MKQHFQEHFEQDIKLVALALHKKYGTKNYDKVMQKIGRLKQKYSRIVIPHLRVERHSLSKRHL